MSAVARAGALLDLGRYDDALAALSSAPPEADAALLRAQCLLALRRPAEAAQQAREALALGADGEWASRLLAYALLDRRRPAEATAAAQAAVEAAPQLHLAHIALSDCRRAQGHAGLALEAASQAVRLAPHQPESHVAVSRSLRAAGMPDRAEAAARTALQLAPQDADAAAALAEVLQSMHRLGEAQEVRLASVVSSPASSERVGELADVTQTALLVAMAINLLLPILVLFDRLVEPMEALAASAVCWVLTGGAFLLLRRGVQRSLSESARRVLAPHRRRQDRAYVAALAAPLLVLTGSAVWDAADGGSWRPIPLLLALTVAAYWFGTQGRDRRAGLTAVGEELANVGRAAKADWRGNQRSARRSQQLLRPIPPAAADVEEHSPAAMFARNASFLPHLYISLGAAGGALWLWPEAPWLAVPAALAVAAIDAAVTDNLWPRLARRTPTLWTLDGLHVRVVDATTGRLPGWGRSSLRGALRLLLLPYLLPQAFRRRTQVWVAPHDRLTNTRVVRVLSRTEAELPDRRSVPTEAHAGDWTRSG